MLPVILGAILGVVVSWINFRLLLSAAEGVNKSKSVEAYVILRNFIRLILYAAVIIASVMLDQINALATGAGILAVALIYFIKHANSKNNRKENSD